MAQSVEHVIGNDEVISSILITSSKKAKRISVLPFLIHCHVMLYISARIFKNPLKALDKFLY